MKRVLLKKTFEMLLVMIIFVVDMGGFQDYRGSVNISPSNPEGSWSCELQAMDSARFNVIISSEGGWCLIQGPNSMIWGLHRYVLWSEDGPLSFRVVNEAPYADLTVAYVYCVWEECGGGSGGGGSARRIDGKAYGVAELEPPNFAWGYWPDVVAVVDGDGIEAHVMLCNDRYEVINKVISVSGPSGWVISPPSGSGEIYCNVKGFEASKGRLKVRCNYYKNYWLEEESSELAFVKLEIENFAGSVYDGEDSMPLVARVKPEGVVASSYRWSAEWGEPAYNEPVVNFEQVGNQVTRVLNGHWYSLVPPPGKSLSAWYGINCEASVRSIVISNNIPADFYVKLFPTGGVCSAPYCTNCEPLYITNADGMYEVVGVARWDRVDAMVTNFFKPTSQFYAKIQAHEEQHKRDFDNGFDGHKFYDKDEFAARIIGIKAQYLDWLKAQVRSEFLLYRKQEEQEVEDTEEIREDRAYSVSDLIEPFYMYQRLVE